ncbi:MAG: Redox-regulated ATPase YchF [Ignavibacteria bacterium]|nr:Redox-regulated ATPase YchF [Ignavibacteria bacterium]
MQIGIVGLPFSGKTTLFRTLANIHLETSALHKKDANIATVKVPDARLDKLTEMFNPKKKVNATIEIVDVIGIQKGSSASTAFSSHFLTKVRTNDAIIHIVRGFDNEETPHPEGSNDLLRDIRTLEEEFILADLAFLEGRFDKLESDMKKPKSREEAEAEIEVMKRWNEILQSETPLRELEFHNDEQKFLKNYQPLTAKPLLIALNLNESDVSASKEICAKISQSIKGTKVRIEPLFAKIEMELSGLPDEDKEMFMSEYGLTESPLNRLLRHAYDLLGLQSFFTVGEDECRAWTVKKGMNAQQAAGTIHTDFFNKFIRAEVVGYKEFLAAGTLVKCKEKGFLKLEGKEYIVKDGDILNIRHG